jgi:hypothetical protein
MAASLLVGLSARLLQWQNPAEFGAQFLNALRARRAQRAFAGITGPPSVRQFFFAKSGDSAVAYTRSGLSTSFRLHQRNSIQSP